MTTSEANIISIAKAIDFIEQHLKEEITLADVADAVFYSLYHFCRMFNNIVHHTPYDYLIRRRLSESAKELITTDQKVIEIAFEYQFNSPETFSRAFKRMFDMQPSQWRKRGILPPRTLMPCLTLPHLQHLNKGDYLKPVLEDEEEFYITGLMTMVKAEERKAIAQLWNVFMSQSMFNSQSSIFNYCGLSWYPDNWEQDGYFYMAGVKVASPEGIGPVLSVRKIPSWQYVRFIHKGRWGERSLSYDYIYHTWLPKSGRCLVVPMEIEFYGQDIHAITERETEWEILVPIDL